MTPEEKAFWNAIKENPQDRVSQLVFADWLDEHERPAVAFALRWAAARGRYPLVTPVKRLAGWSTLLKGQHKPPHSHQLPRMVYEKLREGAILSTHRQYTTVERAFMMLAVALASIRDVIDPDGKGVK